MKKMYEKKIFWTQIFFAITMRIFWKKKMKKQFRFPNIFGISDEKFI
jgi:hypothetical protein